MNLEKKSPLILTQGKIRYNLSGMTLDYSEAGKVKIGMIDYVKNLLAKLPDDMSTGEAPTPPA
jgi:hypothetical protein